MCYCTPNIRTPYCPSCYSFMRDEIKSLREQLENCKFLLSRIENELAKALELMLNPTGLERDRISAARAALAKVSAGRGEQK